MPEPPGARSASRGCSTCENYPLWFTILTQLGSRSCCRGAPATNCSGGHETIPSENVCYPAAHPRAHRVAARPRVNTIFYPCVSYEQQSFEASDNNFNCPVVAFSPAGAGQEHGPAARVGGAVPRPVREPGQPRKAGRAARGGFRRLGRHPRRGARPSDSGTRRTPGPDDIRARAAARWSTWRPTASAGRAGRPYTSTRRCTTHPEMITQPGMAVLRGRRRRPPAAERPLRVFDQWSYHSRLRGRRDGARAARPAGAAELVRLRLDAVTPTRCRRSWSVPATCTRL